jgi:TP901 family phage tail tape measure protein
MAVRVPVLATWDGRALSRAQADMKKFAAQAKAAGSTTAGAFYQVGGQMRLTGEKMAATGRTLSTHMTLPLVGLGYVATKAATEYGSAMTQVQAASDASAKQMDKLRNMAMGMAERFGVSGIEAAGALEDLVKAGLTPAQIAAGGLEQALTLAATGQMTAADASTVLTNALATYGLKAKQSQQVTDSMSAAANATTASVSSLAQGLGNVGPVASQAGLSIQDTAAALGALDQQGIKAAEGGTALKTFLLRLVPQTTAAKTAMENLGLSFVDAKGNIKPMTEVVAELQKKTAGLTREQKQQALTQIFGTRGILAANALMNTGAKQLGKYEAATRKVGGAQKVLNKVRQTEEFQLKKAQAAMKNAATTLGTALAPVVTRVANIVADLASWFAKLSPRTQDMIVKAGLLAAAMGPVLLITGKLISAGGLLFQTVGKLVLASKAFAASQVAQAAISKAVAAGQWLVNAAMSANPIGLVIVAITALIAIFVVLWKKNETFRRIVTATWNSIKAAAIKVWGWLKTYFVTMFNLYKAIFTKAFQVIRAVVVFVFNALKKYFTTMFTVYKTIFVTAWNVIRGVTSSVFGRIRDTVAGILRGIRDVISTVMGTIKGAWKTAWGGFKDVVTNVWDGIVSGIKGSVNLIIDALNGLIRGMNRIKFSAPDWVPGIGGKEWGVSVPEIPHLAKGGIVERSVGGTVAVVGEGRYDEAVIPLTPQLRRQGLGGNHATLNLSQHIDARGATTADIPRIKQAARDAAEEAFAVLVREMRAS